MVWVAVTTDGRSPFVFIDRGVKRNAEYCREKVLNTVLKPWTEKHFGRIPWTFQQDSAPPHSARVNKEWPPKSPDLNPRTFAPGAY